MITDPGAIAIGIGIVLFGIGIVPVCRLIGPNHGQHAAPRGGPLFQGPRPALAAAAPAVVTRARPPWQYSPVTRPDPPAPAGPLVSSGVLPHSADWQTRAMPAYAADAIGHGGDIDAAVDSMWTRALARQLGEQIRDGAL